VLTATGGTLALPVLALRVLVFQPGPNALTTVRLAGYLGLLAMVLIAIGGWWTLKDDRTEAPESAYAPPPPRPAPPERAS
jgi:formate hydrogenlyase subunit 3/multisubunit Na+/H+ antiporter MnhD subunit